MRTEQETNCAIEQYSDMVKRICFLHLKNASDTEDIFQTVFLKYILYSGAFESKEHEKAWIARVTINSCKDLIKSFFRRNTVSIDELSESLVQAVSASDDEMASILLESVLSLPDNYKAVIYLFYYEDYKATEIAKILRKNENTIYTWLSRAKLILRDKLGGEYLE